MTDQQPASQWVSNGSSLPADFAVRLESRLGEADVRRSRNAAMRRWRWTAFVFLPLMSAACWAAIPWTFGIGARALIGLTSYLTLALAVADRINNGYLAYLGLGLLPAVIDILLLIGVVSWLAWASRVRPVKAVGPTWDIGGEHRPKLDA